MKRIKINKYRFDCMKREMDMYKMLKRYGVFISESNFVYWNI